VPVRNRGERSWRRTESVVACTGSKLDKAKQGKSPLPTLLAETAWERRKGAVRVVLAEEFLWYA